MEILMLQQMETHWEKYMECITFREGELFVVIWLSFDVDIEVEVVSDFFLTNLGICNVVRNWNKKIGNKSWRKYIVGNYGVDIKLRLFQSFWSKCLQLWCGT